MGQTLDRPDQHVHFVQMYTDGDALARNVGRYLSEGFDLGESGIVIATPAHRSAFRRTLQARGVGVDELERTQRLVFLDAEMTLARFMVNGCPEWERFEQTILRAIEPLRRSAGNRVRAYGEMVGVLWTAGEYSAAILLEEYWNRVLARLDLNLFCAYPIDLFSAEFETAGIHSILADHTHLLPAEESGALEAALRTAMREVLGDPTANFPSPLETASSSAWGFVPTAQRMILWLRENLPSSADEILRLARRYYRQPSTVCIV